MGVSEQARRSAVFARTHPHPTFPRKRGKAYLAQSFIAVQRTFAMGLFVRASSGER